MLTTKSFFFYYEWHFKYQERHHLIAYSCSDLQSWLRLTIALTHRSRYLRSDKMNDELWLVLRHFETKIYANIKSNEFTVNIWRPTYRLVLSSSSPIVFLSYLFAFFSLSYCMNQLFAQSILRVSLMLFVLLSLYIPKRINCINYPFTVNYMSNKGRGGWF